MFQDGSILNSYSCHTDKICAYRDILVHFPYLYCMCEFVRNFSNFPFARIFETKVKNMDFGSLLSVAQKNAKTNTVSSEVSTKKIKIERTYEGKRMYALIEYYTFAVYKVYYNGSHFCFVFNVIANFFLSMSIFHFVLFFPFFLFISAE